MSSTVATVARDLAQTIDRAELVFMLRAALGKAHDDEYDAGCDAHRHEQYPNGSAELAEQYRQVQSEAAARVTRYRDMLRELGEQAY